MNARNAASEASAVTPAPRPSSSALKASLTDLLASSPALSDLLVLTPASLSQLWALSTALWRIFCSSGISLVTPDSSRYVIRQPSAITPRRQIAAPPPRPSRCRASQPTTGESTAAMIAAVMTGMTMVEVIASSQTTPARRTSVPTSSHDMRPRSRSHWGTAKTWASRSASISTNVDSPSGEPPPSFCPLRS